MPHINDYSSLLEPLLPQDVIAGASIRGRPNFFVIGCFDRRITFYSQQVRALSLVHALKDQGYLNSSPRIAVIGGGAAGVSAAAAAALVSSSNVVLFETAADLLSLQSTTDRRWLDPHIYDWPAPDTTDRIANLPLLDWESGSCRSVREDVLTGFEDIAVRVGARLERRLRRTVTSIEMAAGVYELVYTNLDEPAPPPGSELRERFDMVFLAIGFGLEPRETIHGIQSASYWSDAGVPVGEFEGRPTPRFFISGNGDGGLIDFVAAGARDFDHAAMIRMIARHPGVAELEGILAAIDIRARAADAAGGRFDFIAAYDDELLGPLTASGLISAVAQQLRPGVRLTLQTQHAEMFDVSTSSLNRLAAYLTIKACVADSQRTFRHLQCAAVVRIAQPDPAPEIADFWLDCAGEIVAADAVIIRRGPQRTAVRRPFDSHLAAYEAAHQDWLARHGDATIVPKLSRAARTLFAKAVYDKAIPLPPRLRDVAASRLPIIVQLRSDAVGARWSGAIPAEQLVRAWSQDQPFEIILPDGPAMLGPAAGAVLRVCCHTRNIRLHAMPALWASYMRALSADSKHAEGMLMPAIVDGNPGGAAQDPVRIDSAILARQIHRALDGWIIEKLHAHLQPYLASGDDPGRLVNLRMANDLRAAMTQTWTNWRDSFIDDPALLNHFLRLMVCAVDDDAARDSAQVLVGPTKFPAIVRGTAVALAIAATWRSTAPKNPGPGNLVRRRASDTDWTGHGCAADLIDGDDMLRCAATYMWQTQFVILIVRGEIEVARIAERSFAQIETDQPTLSDTNGSGPVMMWISREFSDAAERGLDELTNLLAVVEARHFTALNKSIERGATV